ncbi:MAG: UvrB/UvrC motif-containing protein [Clostridia bacterium]|nr:UvrB/UvrC motif-containing protein [Clostridia bacterium]
MILCDKCKAKEAVMHRIIITNGKKHAQHFCLECAAQAGIMMFKLPSFAELAASEQMSDNSSLKCVCGHTFSDFKKTGMLGCTECYNTFSEKLLPIISSAQLGRTQQKNRSFTSSVPNESEDVVSLQKLLDEAVATENYEEAVILRDKIRALSRDKQEEPK